MIEREIPTTLTSCTQQTAPPVRLVFKGADGAELCAVVLQQPKWSDWVGITARLQLGDDHRHEDMAALIATCIKEWTLELPIRPEAVLGLPLELFQHLAAQATDLVHVADEQLKNSNSLSLAAGTPTATAESQT